MALITTKSTAGDTVAAAAHPSTGADASSTAPTLVSSTFWVAAFFALIVGGLICIAELRHHAATVYRPPAGVTAFAPMYVLAQAIERLLEPINHILAPTEGKKQAAVNKRNAKVAAATVTGAAAGAAASAAQAQHELDELRANRAAINWGLASGLAMIACGYFNLNLLGAIHLHAHSRTIGVLITGLAIGSGTKPLHDLISNLQSSAGAKKTPSAAKT